MTIYVTSADGHTFKMDNVKRYDWNKETGNAVVEATFGTITNTHRYFAVIRIGERPPYSGAFLLS